LTGTPEDWKDQCKLQFISPELTTASGIPVRYNLMNTVVFCFGLKLFLIQIVGEVELKPFTPTCVLTDFVRTALEVADLGAQISLYTAVATAWGTEAEALCSINFDETKTFHVTWYKPF
jgi:hypothetical protein